MQRRALAAELSGLSELLWRCYTLYRANTRLWLWPAALLIGSGRSSVLVDDAAEDSCSPKRAVERDHVWVVVGWVGAGRGSGVAGAG